MVRKQQPYSLLKTTGHLVSMPLHKCKLERMILRARFWIPSKASDRYFGRFANTAEVYSITDRIREQYTVIKSDLGTPHFCLLLSALQQRLAFYSFLLTACTTGNSRITWLPSMAIAGSILLKQRNLHMTATAIITSLLLKTKSIEVWKLLLFLF